MLGSAPVKNPALWVSVGRYPMEGNPDCHALFAPLYRLELKVQSVEFETCIKPKKEDILKAK